MYALTNRRPRRPVGAVLRFCVMVVVPATNALFRRDWRNLERIPSDGPAVLVVNHVSYADPFVIARAVWDAGRVPHFLAKESLFGLPVAGWILRRAGQIPVRRATPAASHSLGEAVQALRRGEIVVIYPEGTVTRDAEFWPMSAKTGIARLIQLAPHVPVIPVGQWGAQHAVDVYHRRIRLLPRKQVTVSVGAALHFDEPHGALDTAASLRTLTDVVMTAVREQVAQIRGLPAPAAFAARPETLERNPAGPTA